MTFELPELPYSHDALAPYMSAETFEFHHGKHHNAYVLKGNELLQDTGLEDKSLEEIIIWSSKTPAQAGLFNNAAQHWNHSFFWKCMKKPGSGGRSLPGKLENAINESFGSFDAFRAKFIDAGVTQFGSGWVWLVQGNNGKLEIMKTPNAENPLIHGKTALLVSDVWEHSYYIDYRNARPKYLEAFIDHLVHWEHVAELFDGSSS